MRNSIRAFTLIEILVVVAIIAIVTAAVVASVGAGSSDRQIQREAQRLAALIELSCERAQLTGLSHGMLFTGESYAFAVRQGEQWQIQTEGALRIYSLPKGFSLSLYVQDQQVALFDRVPEHPQALCFSSGELTPLRVELAIANTDASAYAVSGDAQAQIKISLDKPVL